MSFEPTVRRPAVAGQFYPSDPNVLRRSVEKYIKEAMLPENLGTVRAVVTPHAGYIYSGPTAGYAFRALTTLPKKERTVFLLGPSHRAYFSGVALGSYAAFNTPLGNVPVAVDLVAEMLARSMLYTRAPEAHAPEHSLEVQLPFLQVALGSLVLVPMLFGDVNPREVAADLTGHIGADDLIVVSSDLSHFYPYESARQLDHSFLDAVLSGDEAEALRGEACGRAPVVTLMGIARRKGWQPHLLDYRNSGDTAGDKMRVVGYGSLAYTA